MVIQRVLGVWLLLAGLLPAVAEAESWQLIHAMTEAQLSAELESGKVKGLVPVELDTITRDGETRYTAILLDEMGEDWSLRIGMDLEGIENKIVELGRAGMFPISISVDMVSGLPRYSAIWLPYDGDDAKWTLSRSPSSLDLDLRDFKGEGFLPVAISGFDWAGDTRYAVVWRENTEGIDWTLRYGMNIDEFEGHIREIAASGLTPLDISAFRNGGAVEFAAISVRMDDVVGEVGVGLSAAEVNAHPAADRSRPSFFAEYDTQVGSRFVVGWHREVGEDDGVTPVRGVSHSSTGATSPNVSSVSAARTVVLPIAPVIQQTPVWCWVSVGEMVFRHLGVPNANPVGNFQCGIIGRLAPPGSPCDLDCRNCIVPSGSNAGVLSMLTDYAYKMTGRPLTFVEDGRLQREAVQREIDNGRPIIAGVSTSRRQSGQSEHVALLVGYAQGADELELIVNDPFPYPKAHNPYLANGAIQITSGQYRISYSSFRDGIFWHWSVSSMRLQ